MSLSAYACSVSASRRQTGPPLFALTPFARPAATSFAPTFCAVAPFSCGGIARRPSSRSAAALRNSRCLSLSFNDIFEPSVSRRGEPIPAPHASPGSARSPGRRVRRRLRRPPTTAYTLSSERKASRFFAKEQCEFTNSVLPTAAGIRVAVGQTPETVGAAVDAALPGNRPARRASRARSNAPTPVENAAEESRVDQDLVRASEPSWRPPRRPQVKSKAPAVSIRKSVTPDYLICLEEGKHFRSLRRHLAVHGLTPEQYREKWSLLANYPMTAPNYAAQRLSLAKKMGLGQMGGRARAGRKGRPPKTAA